MKKENVWLITAKTNLHVGNENLSSYGLIDKAIQRDALTELPCINSSSLKGAINEYCCNSVDGKNTFSQEDRISIFGSDKTDKSNKDKASKGKYVFFDAQILFLPVPDGDTLYRLVTANSVLKRFCKQAEMFGLSIGENAKESIKNALGITAQVDTIDDQAFKALCEDDSLPIIARNCLENGQSTNLWYEQILPPETVLYTMIDPQQEDDGKLYKALNGKIVQIGANATIGYGYCKFIPLKSR